MKSRRRLKVGKMTNEEWIIAVLSCIVFMLFFIIHKLIQELERLVDEEICYIQEIALLYRDDGKEERDDGV